MNNRPPEKQTVCFLRLTIRNQRIERVPAKATEGSRRDRIGRQESFILCFEKVMFLSKHKKRKISNDPMMQTIRKWLNEGHSPTELYDPSFHRQCQKKKSNRSNYDHLRVVPDKDGFKIYRGGNCSPK